MIVYSRISESSDVKVYSYNSKYYIWVSRYKYYTPFMKFCIRRSVKALRRRRMKLQKFWLKLAHKLPTIRLNNKIYPAKKFKFDFWQLDDFVDTLFSLHNSGLRVSLHSIIPLAIEDALAELKGDNNEKEEASLQT